MLIFFISLQIFISLLIILALIFQGFNKDYLEANVFAKNTSYNNPKSTSWFLIFLIIGFLINSLLLVRQENILYNRNKLITESLKKDIKTKINKKVLVPKIE